MAKAAAKSVVLDGHTIACSSIDRVVFPEVGVTKGDVIDYYADVADVMLPELRDRPLSMERFTKGLEGGGFFQKHVQKHYPDWIDRVTVPGKTTVTYPIANTAASLVYFANQGALALHIATSRAKTIEHPDIIVFDLDPPDGGFEMVRKTALLTRDALEAIGLTAFVKTTGSKGLHVVVPLDGKDSYADVHTLGHALGKQLETEHPDLITFEFYKKDRKGRLYFDVMRNTPGATFVAPYSLRGKPTASVSTPIEWDELSDKSLRADKYTLQNVRERLAKEGDPWKGLRKKPGSAKKALSKLRG